uniref:Uncharacterized protein n=1 Tax=Arundo donax TaxID=35708 RepID=A0A0A9EP80_ARUDO
MDCHPDPQVKTLQVCQQQNCPPTVQLELQRVLLHQC